MLLKTVIEEAARSGYREMYLDTLSTSARALILYEKAGFVRTERYNENYDADIFMVLNSVNRVGKTILLTRERLFP